MALAAVSVCLLGAMAPGSEQTAKLSPGVIRQPLRIKKGTAMLRTLLPQRIDNTYRGHKLALLLFALVVSVKILQSLFLIFDSYSIVKSADGIPLETYTPAGAQVVVAIFALSGLSRLIISLLCVLVLVRYRSAITFMFVVLALDYLARELILHFVPLVRTGTPPGPLVNLILFAVTLVGVALSLTQTQTVT